MDFELSQDQRDLQDGIRAVLEGSLSLETSRGREGRDDVVDPKGWTALLDAGVFGLFVPESEGGVGLGLAEGVLVAEEMGRVLVPGPVLSTMALAPILDAARDGIAHGLFEAPARGATAPGLVEHPDSIHALVLLPPLEDPVTEPTLIEHGDLRYSQVLEPLDPFTPLGVLQEPYPVGVSLEGASSPQLRQRAMVLTAGFQVGIATACVEQATAYAKGREQFGRPIGSFQAIKHLLADALCRSELARSAVYAAAVTLDDPVVATREADTLGCSVTQLQWRVVAGAKMLADEAAITNARTAIQVHGGMGFTWEVPMHLFLKRARVLSSTFGTRSQLADMVAALI